MKKYFIFALIIGALIVPRLSLAATSAEIQAQINAIMEQIKQLQTQLTQLQTQQTTAVWCHDFNVNLKVGDKGSEVAALQQALEKEGFQISTEIELGPASVFDEAIASAVTGFQQKYASEILTPLGLKYGTGFVGKATRAKLNKLYGCGVKPPICLQVITPAQNLQTGECKNFPTPCDVPTGWQKVSQCVPVACAAPVCQTGYTLYDTGEKNNYGCPIIKCISPTQNQPPVISGVSGPTAPKVNETGTWTIKASDPEQGILTYSVIWGDEGVFIGSTSTLVPTTYVQTATFTHSYSKTGTYNPSFNVADDKGLQAKTSVSVNVGGTTITPSITVLSPNGGESWQIGRSYDILWTSQNLPSAAQSNINIVLRKAGDEYWSLPLFTKTVNDGTERWTIPSDLAPASNYKIDIHCVIFSGDVGLSCPSDQSNAAFSIVVATTTKTVNAGRAWSTVCGYSEPGRLTKHDAFCPSKDGWAKGKEWISFCGGATDGSKWIDVTPLPLPADGQCTYQFQASGIPSTITLGQGWLLTTTPSYTGWVDAYVVSDPTSKDIYIPSWGYAINGQVSAPPGPKEGLYVAKFRPADDSAAWSNEVRILVQGQASTIDTKEYWPLRPGSWWLFDGYAQYLSTYPVAEPRSDTFTTKFRIGPQTPICGYDAYTVEILKDKDLGYWLINTDNNFRWFMVDYDSWYNWPQSYMWAVADKWYHRNPADFESLGSFYKFQRYISTNEAKYPAYVILPETIRLGEAFRGTQNYYHISEDRTDCSWVGPSTQDYSNYRWSVTYTMSYVNTPAYSGPALRAYFLEGIELTDTPEPYWSETWYFAKGIGLVQIDEYNKQGHFPVVGWNPPPELPIDRQLKLKAYQVAERPPLTLKPLYRLYSPFSGDHFYTISEGQKNSAVQVSGYTYEKTEGYLYPTQQPNTAPLYRLYNPTSHDHFYTMSAQERDSAVQKAGYQYERIEGYPYPTQQPNTAPLYRLYNPTSHDHFYTMSAQERDSAVQQAGYTYESVAGYVRMQQTTLSGALAPSGQYTASILENMKITLDQIQKAINDLYR